MIKGLTERYIERQERKNLFWWRRRDGTLNSGDELSRAIVQSMLALDDKELWSVKPSKKLVAVGSVLHYANTGDCIWGSGINGKVNEEKLAFGNLDVRAVRGPLTKELLERKGIEVPEVFGDPGIIAPIIFPAKGLLKPDEFRASSPIVIPHLNEDLENLRFPSGYEVIMPNTGPLNFIKNILRAESVISASLHGVILAEAYGVPAKLVKPTSDETEFKYNDYYLGTGRQGAEFYSSFAEAASTATASRPINDDIKAKLIDCFPYDIF